MSELDDKISKLNNADKVKMADSLIAKLIEGRTPNSRIEDAIDSLLNHVPFYPEKGKSYDGLFFSVHYGVRGY